MNCRRKACCFLVDQDAGPQLLRVLNDPALGIGLIGFCLPGNSWNFEFEPLSQAIDRLSVEPTQICKLHVLMQQLFTHCYMTNRRLESLLDVIIIVSPVSVLTDQEFRMLKYIKSPTIWIDFHSDDCPRQQQELLNELGIQFIGARTLFGSKFCPENSESAVCTPRPLMGVRESSNLLRSLQQLDETVRSLTNALSEAEFCHDPETLDYLQSINSASPNSAPIHQAGPSSSSSGSLPNDRRLASSDSFERPKLLSAQFAEDVALNIDELLPSNFPQYFASKLLECKDLQVIITDGIDRYLAAFDDDDATSILNCFQPLPKRGQKVSLNMYANFHSFLR